jgi:hypothetical protein
VRAVQNAVLGNTAFLVGIEAVTRLNSIDLLVTIRNNATFDRTPSKFWPGMTQVFVEFLPLENANDVDGTPLVLSSPGNVTFVHKVWPKKVTYDAFRATGGESRSQDPVSRMTCKLVAASVVPTAFYLPGAALHWW